MNSVTSLPNGSKNSIKNDEATSTKHLIYRPDIDGLRAYAIISVVLYHAFPSFMRGGFVGVDVFFVISGYLISSIIFKGMNSGNFSFFEFYQRRVERIFPALILVLVCCYAFGWFTLMSGDLKMLGKHVAGGIGFVQNIVLYRESGYFDTSSALKPLLHLWSLGVEEQFYILFPLVAWLIWRWRFLVLPIIAIIALVSFGADVLKLSKDPSAAFYLPQYRFWEILSGGIVAYVSIFNSHTLEKLQGKQRVGFIISVTGFVLLLLSVVVIDKAKIFPGFWALLPVSGAILIIIAGPKAWLNKRLLASRPLVFLGLISYPLYLWHWPIIVNVRVLGAGELNVLSGVLAVMASTLLAFLTYKYVEVPFRNVKTRAPKAVCLVAIGLALASIGLVTFLRDGLVERPGIPSSLKARQEYAQYFENSLPAWAYVTRQGISEKYRFECDFYDIDQYKAGASTMEPRRQISTECYVPKTKVRVMLWGDSHAQQFYYGLSKVLPPSLSILQVTSSGCAANLPERNAEGYKYCNHSNEFALEVIAKEKPQILVIAQLEQHDVKNSFPDLASKAKALGVKKVIIIGPVPRYDRFLNQIIIRKFWNNTPRRVTDNLMPEPFKTDDSLAAKYSAGQGGFQYLSALKVFCNADGCMTYLGDDLKEGLVTFDYGHLSPAASIYFAKTALAPLIMKDLSAE